MAWPEGIPNWLKNQWGVLSGQVSEKATTAELINALRPYAEAAPGGWGPKGVIYVSQLRSMAVSIRQSSASISQAALNGTIDASMIAEAPWARSTAQQTLAPHYQVRAEVEYTNPEFLAGVEGAEETLTQWVSHFTSTLPGTLEQLAAQITAQQGETGSPPTPVTGITGIEILRE